MPHSSTDCSEDVINIHVVIQAWLYVPPGRTWPQSCSVREVRLFSLSTLTTLWLRACIDRTPRPVALEPVLPGLFIQQTNHGLLTKFHSLAHGSAWLYTCRTCTCRLHILNQYFIILLYMKHLHKGNTLHEVTSEILGEYLILWNICLILSSVIQSHFTGTWKQWVLNVQLCKLPSYWDSESLSTTGTRTDYFRL